MPGSRKRIAFAQLLDWVEGRLPEKEARAVEEQVAVADSATLADVAWLRKFVRATEDGCPRIAPSGSEEHVDCSLRGPCGGPAVARAPETRRRGVDLRSGLRPAVGVRAAGAQGARRQLVYSADALDVALNLLPRARDKKFDLDGQVLSHEGAELGAFSVQLLQSETELAMTVTDDLGGFAFQTIPPGVLRDCP